MPPSRYPAGFAVFLALLAGCNRTEDKPAAGAAPPDGPPQVTAASPKRQAVAWSVEQPGSILPFETTPLVAKLPGYVKEVRKDLGDPVEAGEVLAVIDIPELEREADQKAAAVAAAAAEVEQARRGVDVAAEQVTAAEAFVAEARAGLARTQADYDRWESEARRMEGMVAQKVISTDTLDETRKQFRSAAAARQEAEAKVTSAGAAVREAAAKKGRAEADRTAAEARVKLAEADAKRVQVLLGYREVKAPYKGFVTGRYVHTGHFLQPTGTRPEPLFTVARLDVVRVVVDVPEAFAGQATESAAVEVRVPALGNRVFAGPGVKVTRTARVLSPETRTLRTEIHLPNPDGVLRPGLYVTVRLSGMVPGALVLPAAAVLFADETAYCFAVEDGKVVKLRVQVGRADANGVQVLGKRRAAVTTGDWQPFTGDEKVAVGNLGALADGQPVAVKGG